MSWSHFVLIVPVLLVSGGSFAAVEGASAASALPARPHGAVPREEALARQQAPAGRSGPGISTPFVVVSPQPGDRFGSALAAVGDVNRDGWPDVLVGAHRAEPAGPLSGRAALYSGRNARVLLTWDGEESYDALGWSVARLGDLDADGAPELALGAPAGTPPSGSVRIVSSRDGHTLRTLVGEQPGERFGHAVCSLGDVDGDGVDDLAVGAPQFDATAFLEGRVYVFSGLDGSLIRTHTGAPHELLGQSLGGVGDVDGDGRGDLLIGAPFSDAGAFNAGSARLFSGGDGALLFSVDGAQVGDQLGHWVARAGDLDGDGVQDLAVGAPGDDTGGLDAGAVFVHSGATGARILELPGELAEQRWGVVAAAGDVDGDGRDDLAIGAATGGSTDSADTGRIRLVSGATGEILTEISGRHPLGWFGFALASVGDLDGDGRADVVVGAPGHDDELGVRGSVRAIPINAP